MPIALNSALISFHCTANDTRGFIAARRVHVRHTEYQRSKGTSSCVMSEGARVRLAVESACVSLGKSVVVLRTDEIFLEDP